MRDFAGTFGQFGPDFDHAFGQFAPGYFPDFDQAFGYFANPYADPFLGPAAPLALGYPLGPAPAPRTGSGVIMAPAAPPSGRHPMQLAAPSIPPPASLFAPMHSGVLTTPGGYGGMSAGSPYGGWDMPVGPGGAFSYTELDAYNDLFGSGSGGYGAVQAQGGILDALFGEPSGSDQGGGILDDIMALGGGSSGSSGSMGYGHSWDSTGGGLGF
jgi:hypothetical protein